MKTYTILNKLYDNNVLELLVNGNVVYLELYPDEALQELDTLQLDNIIRSRVLGELIGE